jgi:hypothetical protein
VADALSRRAHP